MSDVVEKIQCPVCAANGRDTSQDNLVMYSTGTGYCFACGYTVSENGKAKRGISALPYIATTIPGKKISAKVCKALGITQYPIMKDDRVLGVPTGKKNGMMIAFPYYEGWMQPVLVRYKIRDYTARSNDRFFWPTDKAEKPKIFGLNMIRRKNTIIICEGESDTCAAFSWLHSEADVLGLSGTGVAEYLVEYLPLIRQYDTVYVCMDADAAGDASLQKLYDILPASKTYYVELPTGKDLYDVWESDKKILKQCFETAYQVTSPKVLTGDTLTQHFFNYLRPTNFACFETGVVALDKMLGGGLYPGETFGLAAHSGHGKTSLVVSAVRNLLKKTKVFIVSTEMDPALVMIKLIEAELKRPFNYSPENPESVREVFKVTHELYHDSLMFYSHLAGDFDDVEEACKSAIDIGARVIFIDVLSDIDDKIRDWQKAGGIMHKINSLAQGDSANNVPPCAIVCILHTKMVDGKYRSTITQSDVLGGKAVMAKLTCGVYMMPSHTQGEFKLLNPQRFLHFFKLPRMRTPQASEGIVRYKDFRYV